MERIKPMRYKLITYKGCKVTISVHDDNGKYAAEAIIHEDCLSDNLLPHISGKSFADVHDADNYIVKEAKHWIDLK